MPLPADDLKRLIQLLPPGPFIATWNAIEQMQDALSTAGPVAGIALEYVNARAQEQGLGSNVIFVVN